MDCWAGLEDTSEAKVLPVWTLVEKEHGRKAHLEILLHLNSRTSRHPNPTQPHTSVSTHLSHPSGLELLSTNRIPAERLLVLWMPREVLMMTHRTVDP